MNNTGKIIALILGVGCFAISGWSFFANKGSKAAMDTAVQLEEPKVLAENEGKLIIISGNVELIEPVYDEEKRLTINTPHAFRQDEEYKRTPNTDENSEDEYEWKWQPSGSANLTGKAKLGDFDIDKDILLAFNSSDQYNDFKSDEISKYNVTKKSDKYHVTPGWVSYYHDTTNWYAGNDREGHKSFSYRYYDLAKKPQVTLVGIQKGNTITKPQDVTGFVFEGIHTKETLNEKNANSMLITGGVFAVLGVIAVIIGLRMKTAQE